MSTLTELKPKKKRFNMKKRKSARKIPITLPEGVSNNNIIS
jgi:hypothetical protein